MKIALESIRPCPFNLRTVSDVDELANSLLEVGQITPITVVRDGQGYLLVSGHRRVAAARQLGWSDIEAYVRDDIDPRDELAVRMAVLAGNAQEPVNPLKVAEAAERMLAAGKSESQVAAILGVSPAHLRAYLRLLSASPALQEAVARGQISFSAWRKLAAQPPEIREKVLQRAGDKPVSLARVKAEARRALAEARPRLLEDEAVLERLNQAASALEEIAAAWGGGIPENIAWRVEFVLGRVQGVLDRLYSLLGGDHEGGKDS